MSHDSRTAKVRYWINPRVQAMRAYSVPESSGLIKLDAMENPYSWPEDIKQRWLANISGVEVNRYPDPDATSLKNKMREVLDIPDNLSIMLGNGSDELILLVALALSGSDRKFLAPVPGFVMYEAITAATGAEFKSVSLDPDDFSLDRDLMSAAIKQHKPAIIFLAYPNNPTGNLFDEDTIVEVVRNAPGLVVMDEAYNIFSEKSFIDRLEEFDNCILMRTFSKSGLAGLRLGYLLGPEEWINEFEKIRLPYNINSLSQATMSFILENYKLLVEQATSIRVSRDKLFSQLSAIEGIYAWPSMANFILFRVLENDSKSVFENLKKQGILIKDLDNYHSSLSNCLRVTVGTEDENTAFIQALLNSL